MSLVQCKECKKEVSSSAKTCPHCGVKLRMGFFAKSLIVVSVLFGVVVLIGLGLGSSPEGQARASERSAIELCWKEQGRKSFDAGTSQFVAGACEMMERNFRNKWNREP